MNLRIFDMEGNEIFDPDLENGILIESNTVKKDAIPIDDITKFAWDDDDYEPCYIYLPNDQNPRFSPPDPPMVEIANLSAAVLALNEAIVEQDEVACAMYEHILSIEGA